MSGTKGDTSKFNKCSISTTNQSCYDSAQILQVGGYNLDVEFFKDHVRDFLVGMFDEHLNYSGTQFAVETAGAGESKGAGDSKVAPPNVPAVRWAPVE